MLTSPDTDTATSTENETGRPGLRARLKRMSRRARLVTLLGVVAGATLVSTSLPASAATNPPGFNFAQTSTVSGTNCAVTVGTYYNTKDYPGTATWVYCGSTHSITVYTQLQAAPMAGGSWYAWGQTPTNLYTTTNTGYIYYYWPECGGPELQWRVVAVVYVDGVYRGGYTDSGVHDWIPCH